MLRLGRQRTYGFLLALIALVILGAGYYFKPAKPANQNRGVPEISKLQSEMERLRQLAQRNSLRNTSVRFSEAASLAGPFLLYEPDSMRSGVVWENGSVLLPSDNLPPPEAIRIRTNTTILGGRSEVWGAGVPLQLVRVPSEKLPDMPDLGATSTLLPGAWTLVVRLDPRGQLQFSPGMFTGRSSIQCGTNLLPSIQTSVPLDNEATGSSVFDLDGNFLGMVVQCDRRFAIIPVEGIRAVLRDSANPDYSDILHSGMEVAPVSEKWQALVKADSGLLVTDVWLGWPADQAGISAGDVIIAVNGNKVNSPAELARTLQSGHSINLMLFRNGRSFAAKLARENTPAPAALEFASDSGVEITTVVPGSKTQRAGLVSGDRILSIGGVRATRSTVIREFGSQGTRPLLATVERGRRQFVAVVQP